jgi:hypothetical protein
LKVKGKDQVGKARSEERHHADGKDEERERQQQVGETRDDAVESSAEVARHSAEQNPHDDRNSHR